MKNLRKPTFRKVITAFFLINFLSSIFLPNYAFALTGGPHQIEYTSYEEPGASDMVNLLTGDFTYNLPILDVPGPEGSFSLPLSYHAGIGLDQEASWVGLGWNINPGAIVRNVNEFPDDASGESNSVTVQDLNVIRGWDSNLGILRLGWNSLDGHYGSVSLFDIISVGWSNGGVESVGIMGLTASSSGVSFDPVTFSMAVISIATLGSSGVISESGKFVAQEALKQTAYEAAFALAFAAAIGSGPTPNAPTAGIWNYTKRTKKKFLRKEYKIWLDHTRTEDMYGVLYLGSPEIYTGTGGQDGFSTIIGLENSGVSVPLNGFSKSTNAGNKGSASDINYFIDDNKEYWQVNNASLLATDDYQVKAAGISGSITPYRLDVGSVSMPREMTSYHLRLAPVQFQDYKVPFIYEGLPANRYYHHVGAQMYGSPDPLNPAFGTTYSYEYSHMFYGSVYYNLKYKIDDPVLGGSRINDPHGNKKIPLAHHVEWLNNDEIKSNITYPSNFLDFLPGGSTSLRTDFRSNFTLGNYVAPTMHYVSTENFSNTIQVSPEVYQVLNIGDRVDVSGTAYATIEDQQTAQGGQFFQMSLTVQSKGSCSNCITLTTHPEFSNYAGWIADIELAYFKSPQLGKAIGGYVITAADGTNYHFALPVYDYDLRSEAIDVTSDLKKTIIARKQAFANTWLLTAITYPDYIDRNSNGLADDGDWGGWIKFNYGKHDDDYQWRSPFSGFKRDSENKTKNFTRGSKQLYYLNSIETRSHVALFLKSGRTDGRSINNKNPLKLDEIILLQKEHYGKLILPISSGGYGLVDFSNQISSLCTSSQFVNSGIRNFINSNAHKRVIFTYKYNLCPGTPNSSSNGKLTLDKLSILGRGSSSKITPDYKFQYGLNPSYGQHLWDGWGFYNPAGLESGTSHSPSEIDANGSAWSLTKVITPLGGEIEINYERDDYASISGTQRTFYTTTSTDINLSDGVVNSFVSNSKFVEGDRVTITVLEDFWCYPDPNSICDDPYTGQTVQCPDQHNTIAIASGLGKVQGNQIILDEPITYSTGSFNCTYGGYGDGVSVSIQKKFSRGGDIRVGSIVMRDEFATENKIRYLYTMSDGLTSGVIGKQNPYAKFGNYSFESKPELPDTPVLYGQVTILNGTLTNDSDYHTKTVYEFQTPHENLVTYTVSKIVPTSGEYHTLTHNRDYIALKHHIIENHTAKIGNLNSIKVFNKGDVLKSSTDLIYTSEIENDDDYNYQGLYTEGTLMLDRVFASDTERTYHKFNRTTVLRYSYALKEVASSKDGNTSKSENTKWDFITGNVLEKVETSPLGLKVKSVTVPAYKISPYSEFGSKALSLSNKNMLTQVAAEYTYLLDGSGNEVGLLGASAQTWNKDWNNYRIYSGGTYTQGVEGDPVWRKGAAYVWRGDYNRLQTDGSQSFSTSDKFNFASGSSNPGWEYVGEPLRYDHYSMTLESKDRNNIYTSSKMGYDNKVKILSASNAEYTEVAFSSAEDFDAITGHFGGEVALKNSGGNATVIKKSAGGDSHTGDCAIQLSSGYGFVYKPTGLKPNQKYRASVWTKSTNGRIYYKLNEASGGVEVVSPAPTATTKAGNWYLINFEIPIGASFTSLEVGVKSASGTVQFDDFRFQPVDASMVCYVYNPLSHELSGVNLDYSEYVLDNDNLYTRYQYNAKGQLNKTFRESIKYNGEKLVSESTSDYRRFYINQ